uniref:MIP18 family protein At1g68310 n=1 Tax=Anthurium amnicola TaxID=1678845 RepID=A0A1D1YAI8_9ARAE
MTLGLINANPVVHAKKERIARTEDLLHAVADDAVDPLDVFDSVRDIRDPEHPYSLEQLSVLSEESITVDEKLGRIKSNKEFMDLTKFNGWLSCLMLTLYKVSPTIY